MLHFWKKAGQKERGDKSRSNSSSPARSINIPDDVISNGATGVLETNAEGPLSGFHEEEMSVGDLGEYDGSSSSVRPRSRLSKTLLEVTTDKSALSYFIQYLEARDAVGLIKFWLDVESFRVCARTRTDSWSGKAVFIIPVTREELLENHKLSIETDCESNSGSVLESPTHSSGSAYDLQELGGKTVSPVLQSPVVPTSASELLSNCESNMDFELKWQSNSERTVLDNVPKHNARTSPEHSVSPTRASNLIQTTLNDAVRIFQMYLAGSGRYHLRVSEEVRNSIVSSICRVDGLIEADCFTECQTLVFHIMEAKFFNDFLRSDHYCRHQIDVLTSGSVALSDILYNETALFHFMEFMEQEGKHSLIQFWIAAENFQQHLLERQGKYDATEAQNDAIVLYEKYFSLQATCPLGFTHKIRFEVEHNICREEGPLPDCFKKPVALALQFMEQHYLKPFLTSELYFKYLTELINTIQASPALRSRKRKSGSECSSELNISIQNTLLAMEDVAAPPRKIIRNIDDREMSIDSRQLYDPDSLWRRRQQSGLSFGRINEMGRFETDVEPEPDKKEESRLSKVVRKLVNKEEDKAKEEMAWQVAEMIVRGICNLKLTSEDDDQQ